MFQSQLLQDGIILLCYGMGVVFVFLTLLFIATSLMSGIIRMYFPADRGDTNGEAAANIGVIAAAIQHYRRKYPR
ncbi:MAG: OadG family protein [Gammaproteobacteria bacterium]